MPTEQFELQPTENYDDSNESSVDIMELCLALVKAEKEEAVVKILEDYGYWNSADDWKNFGDNENNWATIGNQSSGADYALVEKIINSIDHVLIGECKIRGLKVEGNESDDTPQSIQSAVDRFFNIREGRLTNIHPRQRTKLSENIKLIATGGRNTPCYIIADKGEGQTPQEMPDTLLSLNKSNKLKIHFVQGKFNMGGTGALRFCGKKSFQLILSKKNPRIPSDGDDPTLNQWGFTVVQKAPPPEGSKSSVFKYLAPKGKILSFEADQLPILPGVYPEAYSSPMEYGTFTKLYNYELKRGYNSPIYFNLYYRLSLLISNIALPVRLYERRDGHTGHSYEKTLAGLSVRLDDDPRGNLELSFPVQLPPIHGQKIKGTGYAFKKGKMETYSKKEGIVFTVNGQSHGSINTSFFDKKDVGLSYISDSILIILDCSNIETQGREDLFMASRDRLNNDSSLKAEIEKELKTFLKEHGGLRALKNKRRQDATQGKIADNKTLEKTIEKLVKRSPSFSKLFIQGQRLPNPYPDKASEGDVLDLKKFPSYFKLAQQFPSDRPKPYPSNNKHFSVKYKTNAENDYFAREDDSGKFELFIDGVSYDNFVIHPWNGNATLTIYPSDNKWIVGHTLKIRALISDSSRPIPFQETFFVKISEPSRKPDNTPSGKRKKPTTKNGDGIDSDGYLDIPHPRPVKQDEWEKHGFNKECALKIHESPENGYEFFINVDNVHLLTEIKGRTKNDPKILETQYMYGMVLMGLSLLRDESEGKTYSHDDIAELAKRVSPCLLAIISLSELEE